jgi:hypothetical protein
VAVDASAALLAQGVGRLLQAWLDRGAIAQAPGRPGGLRMKAAARYRQTPWRRPPTAGP